MRRRFGCWLLWLLLAVLPAAQAARTSVEVGRDGNGVLVEAEATLAADVHTAFATLTDYESLPRFIPGMTRSRILARHREGERERLLVEQSGELRFLFFSQPIRVWLEVTHHAPYRIDAVAVQPSGTTPSQSDLRSFVGSYVLRNEDGAVRLQYRARIEPAFMLPPLVGTWLARHVLEARFLALVDEIERRALVPS